MPFATLADRFFHCIVTSLKVNSSHCNILTINMLKANVTSDEFLGKSIILIALQILSTIVLSSRDIQRP